MVYKWNTLPGKHDHLDTHAMNYAAAGYEGVLSMSAESDTGTGVHGAGGNAPKKNRRKVYHG